MCGLWGCPFLRHGLVLLAGEAEIKWTAQPAPVGAVEILPCLQAKTMARVCSRIFFLWMGNRLMCDLYSFFSHFHLHFPALPVFYMEYLLCPWMWEMPPVIGASCALPLSSLCYSVTWPGVVPSLQKIMVKVSLTAILSPPSIASKFGGHVLKLFLNIFCPCRCAEVKVAVLQEVPFKNGTKHQKTLLWMRSGNVTPPFRYRQDQFFNLH